MLEALATPIATVILMPTTKVCQDALIVFEGGDQWSGNDLRGPSQHVLSSICRWAKDTNMGLSLVSVGD